MKRLNLGCGTKPLQDATNHDLTTHHAYVDVAQDLNARVWRWDAESFDEIYAVDVLEHLDDLIAALEECWRILTPTGRLLLRVPYGLAEISFTDPTHKQHLMPRSLDYFIRGTDLERDYSFYSWMRWKVREHKREGDNLVWLLEKDART